MNWRRAGKATFNKLAIRGNAYAGRVGIFASATGCWRVWLDKKTGRVVFTRINGQ